MWFVIQSKPKEERRALEHLTRQGFTVYLPLINREKVIRSRVKEVSEPLFSRYMFLSQESENKNFSLIPYTRGVTNLIKFGAKAATVSDKVVESIKVNEEKSKDVSIIQTGGSVRIIEGPLKGIDGIYLEKTPEGRARILIELLSKSHQLDVEHFDLIPLLD